MFHGSTWHEGISIKLLVCSRTTCLWYSLFKVIFSFNFPLAFPSRKRCLSTFYMFYHCKKSCQHFSSFVITHSAFQLLHCKKCDPNYVLLNESLCFHRFRQTWWRPQSFLRRPSHQNIPNTFRTHTNMKRETFQGQLPLNIYTAGFCHAQSIADRFQMRAILVLIQFWTTKLRLNRTAACKCSARTNSAVFQLKTEDIRVRFHAPRHLTVSSLPKTSARWIIITKVMHAALSLIIQQEITMEQVSAHAPIHLWFNWDQSRVCHKWFQRVYR